MSLVLLFIALFHLIAGAGLMFSIQFQEWAVALYGAQITWNGSAVYLLRIIGAFAFTLGFLAAMASRDPLKHQIVVVGFIVFFTIRNISRHLYSEELYVGFKISHAVNDLTTAFFGIQAVFLALLLWKANRHENQSRDSA